MKPRLLALVLGSLVSTLTPAANTASDTAEYPRLALPDTSNRGRNIQRTMRLLATSTPEKRHTVRILFYGQSITEQKWAQRVEDDLRQRFPHANLVIENRALGGFSSQLLVRTAETDLYPFQPDLLIFHVYGSHESYADIIRRVRERTTAEILMQTDHVTKPEHLTEETDPAKLSAEKAQWDQFMNHHWLPALATKYGAELCDQRALWKSYLREHQLEPKILLQDDVHLNAHGEWLMAECVKAYLRYDPKLGPSPAEDWVTTHKIGGSDPGTGGQMRLEFIGSRVEAIFKPVPRAAGPAQVQQPTPPATVRIDGKRPSEFPELYGRTRAVTAPEGRSAVKWPVIAPITSAQPPLLEEWTLTVTKDTTHENLFAFTLVGSTTGPDGTGRSDTRFVSPSGRVLLEPASWNVAYALSLGGIKPVPEKFAVKWRIEPRFVDQFVPPAATDPGVEASIVLASGLTNSRHVLEIIGLETTAIAAVRVYRPPLAAAARPAVQAADPIP